MADTTGRLTEDSLTRTFGVAESQYKPQRLRTSSRSGRSSKSYQEIDDATTPVSAIFTIGSPTASFDTNPQEGLTDPALGQHARRQLEVLQAQHIDALRIRDSQVQQAMCQTFTATHEAHRARVESKILKLQMQAEMAGFAAEVQTQLAKQQQLHAESIAAALAGQHSISNNYEVEMPAPSSSMIS